MSWPLVNLDSICRPRQWKTIASSKLHDEGYTVYGANGKIGFYSEYTHENPTIMITCRGATCGNVNISEPKAYINGNAMALDEINPKEIDINYLKYCLVDRGFRDVISGSAQPQITGQGLSKIKIPLPPLVTQKQIAAVLEKADQLRKDCKQMEQELNSLAQSVFIDMFGDPVTNPKGWDLRALGNLCEKITDGTHKTPTYMNDGVKFLSAKNISSGEINWTNTKYISKAEHQELIKRCNPEIGDVLLAKSGTIGIAAMVNRDIEFSLFESAALIKYKRNLLGAEYVLALLNSESIKQLYRRQTKGNSIKHLHLVDIRSLEVPAPPMGIQKEFENKIKALHSLRANNRLLAQENEMNFNALMQKAFKGELSLKSIKKVA